MIIDKPQYLRHENFEIQSNAYKQLSPHAAHSKADVFAGAEGEVAGGDTGGAEAEPPADQGCCILL